MGAVVDWVQRYMPSSYHAMIAATSVWPTTAFQDDADLVKYRIYHTVVDPALEATVYNPLENNLMGKITTLMVIPAAVDFWGSQSLSIKIATGTHQEDKQYLDRREELWKLYDRLLNEVQTDFGPITGNIVGPRLSHGNGDKITPDPHDFPRLFCDRIPMVVPITGTV